MTRSAIDWERLSDIWRHARKLGAWHAFRGLPYERCAELSWIADYLSSRFHESLRYLDVGSGPSPLPTYLLERTLWDVTCIDTSSSLESQRRYLRRLHNGAAGQSRFHVLRRDLLEGGEQLGAFDIVTTVSVVEHFEGNLDGRAMTALRALLKPGGVLILTTLVNDGHYKEFFVQHAVYGKTWHGSPLFYQRHYDVPSLEGRLVRPSGLTQLGRIYFGDHGFRCFERLYCGVPRPVRALYHWATPMIASRFLTYSDGPVSRPGMRVNTESGVILVMQSPA